MKTVDSCHVVHDAGVPSVVGSPLCDESSVPTVRSMDNCRLSRNELGNDGEVSPAENEDAPASGEDCGKKANHGEGDEVSDEEDSSESDDSDDDSVEDDDVRDIYVDSDDDDDDSGDEDYSDDEDMDSEDEDSGSESEDDD